MSFTDILQDKIAQRRLSGSPVAATAQTLKAQALERVADIRAAVVEMIGRLSEDPVFAAGFGRNKVPDFKWSPDSPHMSTFSVEGPVGSFSVRVQKVAPFLDDNGGTYLYLQICPDWALGRDLGCGWCYAEATPVRGNVTDVSGFIAASEDMLAEFLADVALSPVADKFLPGAALSP